MAANKTKRGKESGYKGRAITRFQLPTPSSHRILCNPVLAAIPLFQNEGNTAVHKWAVTARITCFVRPRNSDEPHLLTLTGIARVRLTDPPQDFKAAAIHHLERFSQDTSQSARKRESWTRIAHLVEESESHKAAALADANTSAVGAEHADKLVLLSTESPSLRLQYVTNVLAKQLSIVEVSSKIATAVDESLSKQQKALFLRQQLAAISAELQRLKPGNTDLHGTGNGVEDEDELDLLIRCVDILPVGSEVRRAATAEARRLKWIPPQNAEHGVVRTYLEWLTSLPWTPPATVSETLTRSDFLTNSKSQLDADHYGLEKVKRRLMEYLAVVRLRALIAQEAETEQAKAQEVTLKKVIDDPAAGAIEADGQKENACTALIKAVPVPVPPPQSLSRAKGIKAPPFYCDFVGPPGTGKTSLGQSIARALGRPGPGLLAQALRKAGRMDPVLLLDEIDKVGQSNYHGDPSAALLEVLYPEQNVAFNLSGYTDDEKLHIARRFLLPKQPALLKTVTHYTREAGVRSLERSIGGIVRFKTVEWAAHVDAQDLTPSKHGDVGYNPLVEADELEKILGLSRYDGEDREREARRGLVWGFVVTRIGEGEIMPVESIAAPGNDLGITSKRAQDPLRIPDAMIDIHLHLPAGAQKKDGPSAGVAMVCAMVSLLTGKCVPPTTAMTGEVRVSGTLQRTYHAPRTGPPVGGVKEKVLGPHRAGANKVIVPWANRKDVEHDVPKEVRARMQFVFARTVREVLDAAFGEGALPSIVPTNNLIPIPGTMSSSSQTSVSSSQFESIINAALREFKEKTGKTF
ncbi:ATP-dependent protease La [Lactarius hengduanensis]|nr:ATP-dependent protease La [Lactarius hengduanensis]